MYKIRTVINGASIEGLIPDDNLTDKQIQQMGYDILRPGIAMIKAKQKLIGREMIDAKEIKEEPETPVILYEILPEPQTQTPVAIVELDGLDRKQLIEQQVLAEQRLADIVRAITTHEKKEKKDIAGGLNVIKIN